MAIGFRSYHFKYMHVFAISVTLFVHIRPDTSVSQYAAFYVEPIEIRISVFIQYYPLSELRDRNHDGICCSHRFRSDPVIVCSDMSTGKIFG